MRRYILLVLLLITTLTSCDKTLLEDKIVIQKIEIDLNKSGYKYIVTLKSLEGEYIYYRTNSEYNAGDTLTLKIK